jgi:hypothetical protein
VALSRIFCALKPGANFYLRDIVFVSTPDGAERDVDQWADFSIKNHDFDRATASSPTCATNIRPSAG